MFISPDNQAILLLCSYLGLPPDPDPAPLTRDEWNVLARKLQASLLKRPGAMLDLSAGDLQSQLGLIPEEAHRLVCLLERGGTLAIELERFESLGIRAITRADDDYPQKYRQRLRESAPPVLFFAGEKALLGQPGIAVVGSRNLDEAGKNCTEFIGNACGRSGLVLYSGGAKGVDSISMKACLEARGTVVGILADSLEKAIRAPEMRSALSRGDACLVTAHAPNVGFSVGNAMGRNRLIYTLADYAIVVASDVEKGGTWAGATEALRKDWIPVFVLEHQDMPNGNRLLLQKGGLPFPHPFQEHFSKLWEWLELNAAQARPSQLNLF